MKNIILFKGGVETQEFFSFQIAKTLEESGYIIVWYDLLAEQESYRILTEFVDMHKSERIVAFTFNYNGIAGEKYLYCDDGSNFWDARMIDIYNMVVDHPLYYHKYIAMVPKNYYQISIDHNHELYMKRFFPEIKMAGFIPLGGRELNLNRKVYDKADYLPISERYIDVIFTGNYTTKESFEKYIAHMDHEYIAFYHSLVDEAIAKPSILIEELAEHRLKEEMGNLSDEDLKSCMTNMMFVDLSVRFHYRAEAVRQLVDNGIKVYTYGAGWNALNCKYHENLIEAGGVNSQKCLDMISQSKISLNVMPWFKNGAHDRVFNTMLNGALCISDDSTYLREQFDEEKDIQFYSLNHIQELPELTQRWLNDTNKMEQTIRNGYIKAKTSHTWECRTKELVKIIEDTVDL